MKVRLLSDLHLEFGDLNLKVMEDENQQVLVLAGDIGIASKPHTFRPFIEEMSERFHSVIFILGNHEYYHTSFIRGIDKIEKEIRHLDNVYVGDNYSVVINDVAFVCATLWTNMNNLDPHTMFSIRDTLNDFKLIRNGTADDPYAHKLMPHDVVMEHEKSCMFIFHEIERFKEEGLSVAVVTHHAPSFQSVLGIYRDDFIGNGGFASQLDEKILKCSPNIWVHGHMHTSFDYMIGETRVVCNPRGYYLREENPTFDQMLLLEIDNESN